jgi:hypothetical protein
LGFRIRISQKLRNKIKKPTRSTPNAILFSCPSCVSSSDGKSSWYPVVDVINEEIEDEDEEIEDEDEEIEEDEDEEDVEEEIEEDKKFPLN